jgi:hypothetical protein
VLDLRHQVALVSPDLARVLVVDGDAGPALPRLPEKWPAPRDLAALVGDPTAFLAAAPWREDDGLVTNLLVSRAAQPLPSEAGWHPVRALDELDLSVATRKGIVRNLAELRDGPPLDGRPAWFSLTWRDDVAGWVHGVADRLGFTLRGEPEEVKIWSLSAVLRFPATRNGVETDVWFKATCDGFHAEPALTTAIADVAPEVMPSVLAVDEQRAWMLLDPIPGADDEDAQHAADVGRDLARLQLDTLPHTETLRAAGMPDRGLDQTLAWLHEVVTASVELPLLTSEQRRAAVETEGWLADQVRELWSLGLPDTLCHGDLHLGNVAWVEGGPIYFDWTDACLSHPYLDAVHLARSAVEEKGAEDPTVREQYLQRWRELYPDVDHDRAWELTRVVERVFQMISYEQIYRSQHKESRWELATVVADFLKELPALRPR